ncbi:hypothetical protein D910_08577 [Dendroctonus ponderosae]|uniref:WW domain-containing protein n=1 Tax=Dendroctonus ponderosae TaxID=77166 RepID=U4UDW1_DENPD|nr:hypothetical protein D910_08577 [Dendroctonus ponderosae]
MVPASQSCSPSVSLWHAPFPTIIMRTKNVAGSDSPRLDHREKTSWGTTGKTAQHQSTDLTLYTKPQTFADCIGNELPLGWEEAYDGQIGPYYINHVNQSTQLEDPRQEWRAVQEAMLRDYLQTAQDVLEVRTL